MRDYRQLQHGWYVSISSRDAALAASGKPWSMADLELADDPENHPQLIDLPGGPQYGLRPRSREALPTSPEAGVPPSDTTQEFVGPLAKPAPEKRLPNPFLSYAKLVDIPASYAGHRIFLHLYKVRYHVTVEVNGRQATHYVGGLEPHRIDITDLVTPGEPALLLITVGDSGVSGKRVFDPYNYTGTRLPTCKEIENNLVHPVNYGGADRAVDEVAIEAVPPVRTEYVFANPKVSRGVLLYTVALANDSDREETVHVHSEAVGAKLLVDTEVTLPPGEARKIRVEVPWPDAILWDLDNPHLYDLVTTLRRGEQVLDTHRDYFGFREFTINGHSFYLNGKKIHLHGNSGHVAPPQDAMTLEEKMKFLRDWKELGHIVHLRLHARPQDKRWVEAADRVGMLLTTETALWTTGFHSFDWAGSEEECYQNVRNHFLEALVRRDRNNPSVVIWSLSNEMSPITPYDLENPKMAAMTRSFLRIIEEAEAEDDSRIIQMSSAMDFLGRLRMYNLHYPKSWQAFPDYPPTAYWLDGSFLFPWYGPARMKMPSWSWRKDKPLYIGEFTCVFGATPDAQACIVGDIAFEDKDHGTERVNAKLWPMEVQAYRRQDVSGFCAWAFVLGHRTEVPPVLERADVAAHTRAVRPLAVLDHGYRTKWFSGDELAFPLSIHNDTRYDRELALRLEITRGDEILWQETMPPKVYGPAENLAFTSRFRAPLTQERLDLQLRATLTSGAETVDEWSKRLEVWPKSYEHSLPADCAFYDPEGRLAVLLAERGIRGGTFLPALDEKTDLSGFGVLWLNFAEARAHAGDWRRLHERVERFVHDGGLVILDKAEAAWGDLPVPLRPYAGHAPGDRLEITYAWGRAPHHPLLRRFTDDDFCLWGEDYYVARSCLETPQEGNVIPLLVAGTDRAGLTASPLLEMRHGRGSYVVSTLELFSKLLEAPVVADLVVVLAQYRPEHRPATVGICLGKQSLSRCREVGLRGETTTLSEALQAEVALIDGGCLGENLQEPLPLVRAALEAGRTVYLHELSEAQTRAVLAALNLPGEVLSGAAQPQEFDIFRHTHPLANGMTHNYLYWIVDKAKVPPWTAAPLHPQPASALIRLREGDEGVQITRRGAVTIYPVGPGRLVIDSLRWQLPDFDEPERPRRYLMCLLTNPGVPLAAGVAKRMSEDTETPEERRERGVF